MPIQLRQICLVAEKLRPVIDDLTHILGINTCFTDPGVAIFGLENTLMPIGVNFLEVVAPVQDGTTAGRYLKRRQGDGGYMVITQADSYATQQAVRQNALDNNVRVAWESVQEKWNICQLHPRDMLAGFFEIDSDVQNDFTGNWHPAGGTGWEDKIKQDVTKDLLGVTLQSEDPQSLAALWARVTGFAVENPGDHPEIRLNNGFIRFAPAKDRRGPGLSAIDIQIADKNQLLANAKQRGCYVSDRQVDIGGVCWNLC